LATAFAPSLFWAVVRVTPDPRCPALALPLAPEGPLSCPAYNRSDVCVCAGSCVAPPLALPSVQGGGSGGLLSLKLTDGGAATSLLGAGWSLGVAPSGATPSSLHAPLGSRSSASVGASQEGLGGALGGAGMALLVGAAASAPNNFSPSAVQHQQGGPGWSVGNEDGSHATLAAGGLGAPGTLSLHLALQQAGAAAPRPGRSGEGGAGGGGTGTVVVAGVSSGEGSAGSGGHSPHSDTEACTAFGDTVERDRLRGIVYTSVPRPLQAEVFALSGVRARTNPDQLRVAALFQRAILF
jgi:hypothetical protein